MHTPHIISQEIEERMIEERRQKTLEERRAGASQVILNTDGHTSNMQPDSASNPMAKLKQLKDMLDAGLITQTEYYTKKSEILSRM